MLNLPQLVIRVCFYREHFGAKHPKYSDTLLDYGFYLLNVDNICQSVAIYQVRSRAECLSAVSRDIRNLSNVCTETRVQLIHRER